jgi:hypothetical protein
MPAKKQTQFQPGQSGNPSGRPKGARHRATLAIEELLDGEAEALTRKAIEMALAGDNTAMRLCLERLVPVRRDRPIMFDMQPIETAEDVASAGRALMSKVAGGEVTPAEAGDVMKLFEGLSRSIEVSDLERRLRALEEGPKR